MNFRIQSNKFVFAALLLLVAATPLQLAAQTLPKFGHVVIVLEENTGYSSVVGSSNMPYLNSLINQYGLATSYFADTHPSIGNYFALTTGQILTNDDGQTPSSFPVSQDNIALELQKAGKAWKDYRELNGNYYVRHDPLAYMTNINSAGLVSFSQFAVDLANGALPQFSFIVPNGCDDAHDCSLSTADNWLQTNIDPLVKNTAFQKDGLLIVVFDENSSTGTSCSLTGTNCGGQVADVIVSPFIKSAGYKSSVSYNHESTLRLMAEGLGLTTFPGRSSSANNMADFFSGGIPNTPVASLSPTSASFGSVNVGSISPAKTFTLSNTGNATLTITSIAANSDFSETNTCGSSVAAGANCTINVTFDPTTAGAFNGALSVTDNAAGSPQTLALSGTGASTTGTPGASLSPASLSFGSVTVGSTSPTQTVTLTNTGSTALSISGVAASSSFAASSNCGSSLAAGAPCTISVTFNPTITGTFTGQLLVSDNASGTPQAVGLAGSGVPSSGGGGSSALSPSSLTFASQTVATTSAAQPVTFTNTTGSRVRFHGISASSNFGESNNCPGHINAGSSCTINVTFSPSTAGPITGTLNVNAGSQFVANLTGVGSPTTSAPAASLSPTSLSFGTVNVGTPSAAQTVTLMNNGGATLNISSISANAPFTDATACGGSLAPGASCAISVTFTPTTAATLNGTLSVADNAAGSPQLVSLSGTGGSSPTGGITLTPSSFSFGTVPQGTSSATVPFVLNNGTSSPAAMGGIWVGWQFSQTNNCGSSLAAGASCTINVTFTAPTYAGSVNETLVVAAGGSQITVPITASY